MSGVNIPVDNFEDFVCKRDTTAKSEGSYKFTPCNGTYFKPVVRIKTYRGFLSQGQTVVMQMNLFQCLKCGAVHDVEKPEVQAHGGMTLKKLNP